MTTPTDIIEQLKPVLEKIAATAAQRETDREFPRELAKELFAGGFGRLRIPTELGGLGFSLAQTFPVLVAVAAADSNIAQGLRPHFLAIESLIASPPSEQREYWLKRVVAENLVIGNAMTEVGNKTDELNTKLLKSGEQYLLNGTKFYSTGSLYADRIEVHALDEQGNDVFVLVNRDAPGVALKDDWDGFGQQLSASGTSVFTDVAIAENEIFPRNYTAPSVFQALAQAHHLSTLTGISQAIVRDIVEFVRGRNRIFSHGSGDLPRYDPQVQQVIGEVQAKAYAVESIFAGFSRALDNVTDLGESASEEDFAAIDLDAYQAQLVIVPLVLAQATQAFEVGGASAASKKLGLDRHWRNARVLGNHNPLIYRARLVGANLLNGGHAATQYTIGSA